MTEELASSLFFADACDHAASDSQELDQDRCGQNGHLHLRVSLNKSVPIKSLNHLGAFHFGVCLGLA